MNNLKKINLKKWIIVVYSTFVIIAVLVSGITDVIQNKLLDLDILYSLFVIIFIFGLTAFVKGKTYGINLLKIIWFLQIFQIEVHNIVYRIVLPGVHVNMNITADNFFVQSVNIVPLIIFILLLLQKNTDSHSKSI